MRDPLNGISTSTLANAIVSNFGNPMDIDAVLAVLGQSLIEGAFSFGELIDFMECMDPIALSSTLVNNFSNQTLLLQLILDNANQEYILSLVMSRDPDFVKEVAESYPYLVAEAVRKLEGMSVEQYLALVKKHYGDGVMGDLLSALSGDLLFTKKFVLNEHHLYGSSRLGVKTHKRVLLRKEFSISGFEEDGTYIVDEVTDSLVYVASSEYFCRVLAQKQYELSNHLGNVLATVLDRRTGVFDEGADTLMYYTADVVTATLFYPFGMSMMGYKNEEFSYSFDFNGKETDSETGLQDYGERIYNKAIARFLSADPLIVKGQQYPWYSPYQFAGNMPIIAIDLDGLEEFVVQRTVVRNSRGQTIVLRVDWVYIEESNRLVKNKGVGFVFDDASPRRGNLNIRGNRRFFNRKYFKDRRDKEVSEGLQTRFMDIKSETHYKLLSDRDFSQMSEREKNGSISYNFNFQITFNYDGGRNISQFRERVNRDATLFNNLDNLSAILVGDNLSTITITGMASNVPTNIGGEEPNTTYENNKKLAEQRAQAAKEWIIAHIKDAYGVDIDPARIIIKTEVEAEDSTDNNVDRQNQGTKFEITHSSQ
ncbi:MAG: hypothetical protein M9892_07445 [Bacteroidetes bacterium]|nr:hypothetical protein [Bacteroidota bacterium]